VDRVVLLSHLVRRPVVGRGGEAVGRLSDVIVRLRGRDYPLATGLVVRIEKREVFLPIEQVADFDGDRIQLTREVVDLRPFERREGEVLLSADVLGHRVIDVADVELVKAHDIELRERADGWVVDRLDTHPHRPRLFGLGGGGEPHWRDWKAFEPLIGHAQSARARGPFGRLGRLKAADLADLLEEANRTESDEILNTVHADPELEADVFEELEPDSQTRLLGEKSDAEIAGVLARMRADDAADAINDLPQRRRHPVLNALPAGQRAKVLTLLGFNPSSAGGLMTLDILTAPPTATVAQALDLVRAARTLQPEAITSVHVVEEPDPRLIGTTTLMALLQADPSTRLDQIMTTEPVRVLPDTDCEDVALLMTDYNLLTVPVVDEQDRILGVITVDDILETVIPEDWRRREPAPHPAHGVEEPEPEPDGGPNEATHQGT
jgi:CBS domain-containing protein/sporulation protein YlmC with PRC-barrel domain